MLYILSYGRLVQQLYWGESCIVRQRITIKKFNNVIEVLKILGTNRTPREPHNQWLMTKFKTWTHLLNPTHSRTTVRGNLEPYWLIPTILFVPLLPRYSMIKYLQRLLRRMTLYWSNLLQSPLWHLLVASLLYDKQYPLLPCNFVIWKGKRKTVLLYFPLIETEKCLKGVPKHKSENTESRIIFLQQLHRKWSGKNTREIHVHVCMILSDGAMSWSIKKKYN